MNWRIKMATGKRPKRAPNPPQVGDVWESIGGKLRVKVTNIFTGAISGTPMVDWVGINRRESGGCAIATFPRGRRLVERDGKAVSA